VRNALLLIFMLCGIVYAQELQIERFFYLDRGSDHYAPTIEQITPNEIALIGLRKFFVFDTLGRVDIDRIIPGCDTSFSLSSYSHRIFRLDTNQNPGWLHQKGLRVFDEEGFCISEELYITRITDDGDSLWSFVHDIEDYYGCSGICEAGENNFWAAGIVYPPQEEPTIMHFLKFSNDGELLMERFHDSNPRVRTRSFVRSIAACENGGLIGVGKKEGRRILEKYGWMLRLDSEGDTVWTRMVEAAPETLIIRNEEFVHERVGEFEHILELNDGNYLVGGFLYHNTGGINRYTGWMLKISSDGEIIWEREIREPVLHGNGGNFNYYGWRELNDGNILYYEKRNHVEVIIFDPDGNSVFFWLPEPDELGNIYSLGSALDGGFYAWEGRVVKLSYRPNDVLEQPYETKLTFCLYPAFPNPFNSSTHFDFTMPFSGAVSLSLFNSNGRRVDEIFNGVKPTGVHSSTVNANDLHAGVYFLRLDRTTGSTTQKIILMR